MCGIAGVIGPEPAEQTVRAMLRAIAHRGPDGEGVMVRRAGGRVATFGHVRLSIVDLENGAQPMEDRARSAMVSFNGEIYDHARTRALLEREGVELATRSDTEVIVAGWALWGEAILERLHGMFAFAVFDERDGTVLIARDRAGIKPVFLVELEGGRIAFASELSAILEVPGVRRAISRAGLASFLFSDYAHPPHTLLEGVTKLAPGERWLWRPGERASRRSFLEKAAPLPRPSPADLWRVLGDAVESQLMSDVPLGVFLSGGLDSACIAALAKERSATPLTSFSIAFDDPTFDESAHARETARHLGIEHVEETLTEDGLLEVIEPVLAQLDEPLGDHSIVPTYVLCRLAARHVKVVLGGDGADELFGGYPTYRAHAFHARLAAPLLARFPPEAIRWLLGRIPSSDGYQSLDWKVKRFLGRWDSDVRRRHLRWMSALDLPELREAMGARFTAPATLEGASEQRDPVALAMHLDRETYLPGSVLTKLDRASMAHGLEARPPFLDEELVALAGRVPRSDAVRGRTGKRILRAAAARALPPGIVGRKKHGFSVPLAAWLRGPLAPRLERTLRESPAWSVLEPAAFRRFAEEHRARRGDHAKGLWALLVLDAWMRRFAIA